MSVGKAVGVGLLGLVFGGPIGCLLGAAIGAALPKSEGGVSTTSTTREISSEEWERMREQSRHQIQQSMGSNGS